jgi:hypothetical protein
MFPDDDPLGSLLDDGEPGADLLDGITTFLRRFVVFPDNAQVAAIALWIVHTHAFDAAEVTPYLAITSAEKRSGKTRTLDILELLTPEPWRTINPTGANLFRSIAEDRPTLLLDEVDAVFGSAAQTRQEGMRAVLNEGYKLGASVRRRERIENRWVRVDYPVFCPKAFAGIGTPLPDTVADRAIPIRLQRRAPTEAVEQFRRRFVVPEAVALRDRIGLWAMVRVDDLRAADPQMPPELIERSDRAAEVWEPLFAIADMAGGEWPTRARAAAVLLHGADDSDETLGVLLLRHIRAAFDRTKADKMGTWRLLKLLVDRGDGPWSDMWGEAVRAEDRRGPGYRLAARLKPYGIKPGKIRVGERYPRGLPPIRLRGRLVPLPARRPKRRNHGTLDRDPTGRGTPGRVGVPSFHRSTIPSGIGAG